MEGSGITVGTAHADDSNPPAAAAQLEPDDILMSVAMSRLCMQSDRVIRAVRREAHHASVATEECDDIVSMGEETNADIVGALSADVWQRWLDVCVVSEAWDRGGRSGASGECHAETERCVETERPRAGIHG